MDAIFSLHSISISDLREAPARAFEQAGDEVSGRSQPQAPDRVHRFANADGPHHGSTG